MPAAIRITDTCTGHDCFPPRKAISGSENVIINNLKSHRETDKWATHQCISSHDGILSVGSETVFINNLPAGRVGDAISCGSVAAMGSLNVFIG